MMAAPCRKCKLRCALAAQEFYSQQPPKRQKVEAPVNWPKTQTNGDLRQKQKQKEDVSSLPTGDCLGGWCAQQNLTVSVNVARK
eukprot:1989441-Pleurochrysis_carterae.AAC.1